MLSSLLSLLLFAVALFLFILLLLAVRAHFAPGYFSLRNFPGPPIKPVFGNAFEFTENFYDLFKIARRLSETYGSPTRIKVLGSNIVMLFQAEHVEALFKNAVNLRKGLIYDILEGWLGTGLLTSHGAKWHTRRKQLTPSFHFQILRDSVPIFTKHSNELCEKLTELIDGSQSDQPIEIGQYLTLTTLDAICETAMGTELYALQKGEEHPYVRALFRFSKLVIGRLVRRHTYIMNNFFYNQTPQGKMSQAVVRTMHQFTRDVIAERDAACPSADDEQRHEKRQAFLDSLLEIKRQGQLTLEEVREEVDTFMFEGHDTTATGLKWALYCIGCHPEVQRKLQEELDTIFGDSSEEITVEKLNETKYLDRVLKECQRLYPPVPFVSRRATEDMKIGSERRIFSDDTYTIPKGVIIIVNFLQLHRDPNQFPDPDRFDPDRFLPENSSHRHPFAFLPFAAGPRNCIGQKFAVLEMKVILADILRRFSIESIHKENEMKPSILLVLRPSNGVWLKFHHRS